MSRRKILIFGLFFILMLIVSGCSISVKKKETGVNDKGLYKTETRGDAWTQRVSIPTTTATPKGIGRLSTMSLAIDPSDNKAIYLGTEDNGLFYSYDGANSWQKAETLGNISIKAVAIDNESKCIIYTASTNKVYKSTDCNRTWAQVYFDNDVSVSINTIAIDHYNSSNVYIGTSRGEVIRSSDKGVSWQTIGRFNDRVEKVVLSPQDSRTIFVGTAKKGIHRSLDNGESWVDLSGKLEEFEEGKSFRDLVVSSAQPGLVVLAIRYGLIQTDDNGENWKKIELITPEKDAIIKALALGPKDGKEIYYATNTTFFRSLDGGQNWTSKKLPTTGLGQSLAIDYIDTGIIYLGVKNIPKK